MNFWTFFFLSLLKLLLSIDYLFFYFCATFVWHHSLQDPSTPPKAFFFFILVYVVIGLPQVCGKSPKKFFWQLWQFLGMLSPFSSFVFNVFIVFFLAPFLVKIYFHYFLLYDVLQWMSMLTNKNHCHKITSRGKESKVNSRMEFQ